MSLCNYNKTDEKKEGEQTRTSLGSGFGLNSNCNQTKTSLSSARFSSLENSSQKLDHSSLCLLRCSETLIGTTLVMFLLRTSLMNY